MGTWLFRWYQGTRCNSTCTRKRPRHRGVPWPGIPGPLPVRDERQSEKNAATNALGSYGLPDLRILSGMVGGARAEQPLTPRRSPVDAKLKHLEMLQGVINRMAGNSFLLKGWCVTLVSALLALAASGSDKRFTLLPYYPVLMFWILDGYFLRQERLFRKLYERVRLTDESLIDFSMDTDQFKNQVDSWFG